MRAMSLGYAAVAAVVIGVGFDWAIGTEPRRPASDIAASEGQRYATVAPSEHDALSDCVVCHRIGPGGPDRSAPSLYGIVGAPVARSQWFAYSPALRTKGGRWTAEEIDRFLENPVAYLPGTFKTLPPVRDTNQRHRIIEALKAEGKS